MVKKLAQNENIPFTKPTISGDEISAMQAALRSENLATDGGFSRKAISQIERITGAGHVRILNSCTSALEAAMLALKIGVGDEVILPSFNFPSAANAVALYGAIPVFVDIDTGTMNIDASLIESAITKNTKAIILVHYAGVAADMDNVMRISKRFNVPVIEDAAQCLCAFYKGSHLGTIGDIGTLSFHATKNINCSQGGAILVNHKASRPLVDVIIEKGTDRRDFFSGKVSKYNWKDLGSAYVMSEVLASMLTTQLRKCQYFTSERLGQWQYYYDQISALKSDLFFLPKIPKYAQPNGHIFYIHLSLPKHRPDVLTHLQSSGVQATTHFEPLHLAPAGQKFGRAAGTLDKTVRLASSIIRLPLWAGMTRDHQNRVIECLVHALKAL